jgi:hypothetical protein
MSQPDGRLLGYSALINWVVGSLLLFLLVGGVGTPLRGVHPLLFLVAPLMGFLWFLRSSPPPQLTAFFSRWRSPGRRKIDTAFQLLPALLPWFVLVRDTVR